MKVGWDEPGGPTAVEEAHSLLFRPEGGPTQCGTSSCRPVRRLRVSDPPRYRLQENAPALTKAQWCTVGTAFAVGLVGLILIIVARISLGAVLLLSLIHI